jgi:hypothetical protein
MFDNSKREVAIQNETATMVASNPQYPRTDSVDNIIRESLIALRCRLESGAFSMVYCALLRWLRHLLLLAA